MNEHTERKEPLTKEEQPDGYTEIGYDDIKRMYEENMLEARECERVTDSS